MAPGEPTFRNAAKTTGDRRRRRADVGKPVSSRSSASSKGGSDASSTLQRPITSTELAALIGVSRTTVSIVLRGDAHRRMISAATVQKVLDGVQKYNYTPNPHAQNLRSRRSMSVSVVCSNFALDWADRLLYAMEPAIEAAGYTLFVAAHRSNTERHRRILSAAAQRRDAGVICMPIPGQEAAYRQLVQSGIPLIFLGDYPTGMPDVSRVVWEAGEAARQVVQHLVDTGRRRIAYVGNHHPLHMHVQRLESYRAVLARAGLMMKPEWIVERPAGLDTVDRVLDPALDQLFGTGAAPAVERPDAIYFQNDGLALGALGKIRSRGLRIPQDVAVVGMGDLPLAGYSGVDLTTVSEPIAEMGRVIVDVLLRLIDDPTQGPIVRSVHSSELHVRGTSSSR